MRNALGILLFSVLILAGTSLPAAGYNDHRGHNLDSLERVVARWTPDMIDRASTEELIVLNRAYRDLMLGYSAINGEKCMFYARKALSVSHPRGWNAADQDALRYLGMQFYGREQYDSALVYYRLSLEATDRMAAGATSPTEPEGYSESQLDDAYSSIYGAIGNLYNMMDSIPQAMEWYEKAGELFEKNGWNESNSVLHYNIGETWVDEGDFAKAKEAYEKALSYAEASGDSLMIVDAWKGFGRLYMEQGKTWKSLPFLRKADAYYAAHPDFSPNFRTENLDYMKEVLSRQKLQFGRLVGALVALLLVAAGFLWQRRRKSRCPVEPGMTESVEAEDRCPVGPGMTGEAEGVEDEKVAAGEDVALSEREKEVLDLLSKGYTTQQIADALHLGRETIRWYRKKLLAKFDVSNTPEMISRAKEQGLI